MVDLQTLTPLLDRYGFPIVMCMLQWLFSWMLLRQNGSNVERAFRLGDAGVEAQRDSTTAHLMSAEATKANTQSNLLVSSDVKALGSKIDKLTGCEAAKLAALLHQAQSQLPQLNGKISETS